MAYVYILYSAKLKKYYIGSCLNLEERIAEHNNKKYSDSFTRKTDDWVLYFAISNLENKQARLIEKHIKEMKSQLYSKNIKSYKEISEKLIEKYKQ